MEKTYLGDGVYVEYDRDAQMVKLTTSDGLRDTNTIYLDTHVLLSFEEWVKRLQEPPK